MFKPQNAFFGVSCGTRLAEKKKFSAIKVFCNDCCPLSLYETTKKGFFMVNIYIYREIIYQLSVNNMLKYVDHSEVNRNFRRNG